MSLDPRDVPLRHVDTSKGEWGIFVQSVVETWNGNNLFMTIILEQNIADERVRTRKLEMLVAASELASPSGRERVLNEIRQWIEAAEGDGSLTIVPD